MTFQLPSSFLHRAPFARLTVAALLSIVLADAGTAFAQNGGVARGALPSAVGAREPVTLNFSNAEIEAVARTLSTITGRNMVVDPRVKGTMSLMTERPVPPNVAFDQFLAALRLQGFTVVESAGLYKVVPEADAKLQGGSVTVSNGAVTQGNQIVTQIFRLNFENAANLVPVLRPLISPNNTINVNPGNNSLVITDYADNLQRLARIIASMDVSNATDVEVIPLRYANATDVVPLVNRLIEGGGQAGSAGAAPTAGGAVGGQSDNGFRTTLIAEPRSNALIVRSANPARLALVRSLVARLDQPTALGPNGDAGNIYVVYLKNAEATRIAVALRASLASLTAGSGGSTGGTTGAAQTSASPTGGTTAQPTALTNLSGASNSGSSGNAALGSTASGNFANSAMPSTGGAIQADPATNSLIITATEPQYRQLRAVIEKLDGRRAQVLVESLIVEVNASRVAEFGIQWQTAITNSGTVLGVLGTNSSVGGANLLTTAIAAATGTTGISSAVGSLSNGLNLGVTPRINGNYYLGALANFLQSTADANVLSTPNLLTLDNEEAKIVIGQNVPFITGSTLLTSGAATSPYTSVERRDVGLTLRVKPQINADGTVKLAIFQEVSNIVTETTNNTNGPTTNKRSIESNVLVDDGSVVVLGGLLSDDYQLLQDKIPVLGDVPILGALFRSEQRTRAKKNLMVFLRPVVVRSSTESDALTEDRYDAIRTLQRNTQPVPSTVMRSVDGAPILPAFPRPAGTSAERGITGTVLIPAPLAPNVTAPSGPPRRGVLPPTSDPLTRQETP